MKTNGKHLNEQSVLLANQKKHINSLNRLIWILIRQAGGEVRVSHRDMALIPDKWNFSIAPDPNKPEEIVFKATDGPQEAQQAAMQAEKN